MREYLYRGKRKDNGEWHEGHLVQMDGRAFIVSAYTASNDPRDWERADQMDIHPYVDFRHVEVDPDTVGQCTNWNCAPGAKVFEGDILRFFMYFERWQTHRGDNIPGGMYTEPDEPFAEWVDVEVIFDKDRGMWSYSFCGDVPFDFGDGTWEVFEADRMPIISKQPSYTEFYHTVCASDEVIARQFAEELKMTLDEFREAVEVIEKVGNRWDNPTLLSVKPS